MALAPKTLREYFVFLASPGDMLVERQKVRDFFDEYNLTTARPADLQFKVIDFENYATTGAGSPQELITKVTLERHRGSLALVIGLMGQRFGTPTGDGESGTEKEFLWALEERKRTGWPEIKWFFKNITELKLPPDPKDAATALKQWKKVLAFKKKVQKPGPHQLFYKEFEDDGFLEVAGFDLRLWLNDLDRPWFKPRATEPEIVGVPSFKRKLLSAEAFFRPLMDRGRLFSHVWSLVGRQSHMRALLDFVDSNTARIAFIAGRPGMGKSKLLQEFAAQLEELERHRPLVFVPERASLAAIEDSDIPTPRPVVVVDDAHRVTYIDGFLALCRSRVDAKIIVAARTYWIEQLRIAAAGAGYEHTELLEVEPLRELAKQDVVALARQVLGEAHAHLAEMVAAATRDSPLITVVAAKLIAEKAVSPALLTQHEEFQHTVMSRFREELLGELGDRIPPDRAKELLRMIAATEPIMPGNQSFCEAAATFLNIDVPTLVEAFGILESVGVLLRRGKRLRITPDVLSEYLLREACINSIGQSTGYDVRIYDQFSGISLAEIMRNLFEVEWREQKVK